jgi:hypothetical protein
MAKIHEEVIIIKISKLVKANSDSTDIISAELLAAVQEISEQLVPVGCVVELETIKES